MAAVTHFLFHYASFIVRIPIAVTELGFVRTGDLNGIL